MTRTLPLGVCTIAVLCCLVLAITVRADVMSCFTMYSCHSDPIAGSPANGYDLYVQYSDCTAYGYEHLRRETCSNSTTACRTDCEAYCSNAMWCGYSDYLGVISYYRPCVD